MSTERRWFLTALAVSVILALISLVISRTMGYDQQGWAVYARELFGPGKLDTNSFPAWKPLPILLIGPVTWFTHGQFVSDYWLFLERVCAFMTVFGGAAVACRFAGRWAAAAVVVLVVISSWWLYFLLLGFDGIPAAALLVGAVYVAQRGSHRWAIVCLVGISLLRPEGTVFLACYSLWAWRSGRISVWEAALSVLVIAVLWAVPEILQSGKSSAALSDIGGTAGTPITTGHPFRATLTQSIKTLGVAPSVMVGVAALSTLWGLTASGRRGAFAKVWGASALERALLVFGVGWILIVALETLHGFSGNSRYNSAGIMALTLVAAVTAVRLGQLLVGALAITASKAALAAGAVVLIVVATMLIPGPGNLSNAVTLTRGRVDGVRQLRDELDQMHCPGYYWGNPGTNAWLAQMTGQSVPSSIVPGPLQGRLKHASIWKIWCAPAGWRPSD